MHFVPVEPGLRLVAEKSAVLLSSSPSATVPAAQLLVGLSAVALNAEYDACQTSAELRTSAAGTEDHLATAANRDEGSMRHSLGRGGRGFRYAASPRPYGPVCPTRRLLVGTWPAPANSLSRCAGRATRTVDRSLRRSGCLPRPRAHRSRPRPRSRRRATP